MADSDDARAPSDIKKSIAEAIAWNVFAHDVNSDQEMREQEDLAFQRPEGAWPEDIKQSRSALNPGSPGFPTSLNVGGLPIPARPMVSIASLDEPIALVASQERGAHLGVQIHALSEDATDDTAEVFQGIYRCIERDSLASMNRSWAYARSLWCGRGYYRVGKEYDPEGGHPLDQKITLDRILDGSGVLLDPYAQKHGWQDGERAQLEIAMPWRQYTRKYKTSRVASFDEKGLSQLATDFTGWITGDSDKNRTVKVVEDWRVEITKRTHVMLDDNSMAPEDDIPTGRKRHPTDDRTREIEDRRIFWRVINCEEELEPEQEWDGTFMIPVFGVVARELQPYQGKREWIGMVANAKGAVRLTNYAASGAVEKAALEPKAPWQGEEGVFEGHEQEYLQSNIRNIPFLQHRGKNLSGEKAPAPIRVQTDMTGMSINMQLLAMGKDFVHTATATYPPSLGMDTPAHRSGVAINSLQNQSIQSNSPYLDNLANITMTLEAKTVIDMIPRIYDRPQRIVRILGKDDKTSLIMVNHPFIPHPKSGRPVALPYDTDAEKQQTDAWVADPNHPAKHYNLKKGRYGVEVNIGKSYKDARDEGVSEMGTILQADPQMMQIVGPEYFAQRGEPWAEQVSDLLKKNRSHTMPWLDDNPQPDLHAQLQQATAAAQAATQKVQELSQVVQTKQVEHQYKAQIAQMEIDAKTKLAIVLQQMKDATTLRAAEITAAKEREASTLEAQQESIALGQQHDFDAAQAAMDRAHEALMAQGDHASAVAQSDQDHQEALAQGQQAAALAPPPPPSGDQGASSPPVDTSAAQA